MQTKKMLERMKQDDERLRSFEGRLHSTVIVTILIYIWITGGQKDVNFFHCKLGLSPVAQRNLLIQRIPVTMTVKQKNCRVNDSDFTK